MKKLNPAYLFIFLFLLLSALSLYKHKNIEEGSFRSEIWADRAGYYVYLPSTFIYSWSASKIPNNRESISGNGFSIDRQNNKVVTKYTCGVAIMELPFFLIADLITTIDSSQPRDGFSFYYRKLLDIAAAFYLTLGLYLLYLSLKRHFSFSNKVVLLTLVPIFLGTNLYYYGIVEVGMSHVYSFFLFSLLIYLVGLFSESSSKYVLFCGISITMAFIFLIRPINILAAGVLLFYEVDSVTIFKQRIRELLNWKMILLMVASFLLAWLPQLLYWKYVSGSYFSYSYKHETFTHLFSPNILEVLFSPKNGLIPYSMLVVFMMIAIFFYLKAKPVFSAYIVGSFLLVCYLTAAWHDWSFGCGSGMRNSVEYLTLLSFPFCFWINKILNESKNVVKFSVLALILAIAFLNLKINYYYFGCYFDDTWNWGEYIKNLLYPFHS